MFDLGNKVALITGGASGIGLCCAKELLRNGLKAVVLADLSTGNENNALVQIAKEFGENKAGFIKTDICEEEEFENAFKFAIETFGSIDILVNNAGIMNDAHWKKEITVNLYGIINGCLLALEKYLPEYRTGSEGVVVNMCSKASFNPQPLFPIYCATKHAGLGLSRCLGVEMQYQRKQVRFLTVCPGRTDTMLHTDRPEKRTLGTFYQNLAKRTGFEVPGQSPENVAKAVVDVINTGKNGSIWVVERNEPAYEVEIPPLEKLRKITL